MDQEIIEFALQFLMANADTMAAADFFHKDDDDVTGEDEIALYNRAEKAFVALVRGEEINA